MRLAWGVAAAGWAFAGVELLTALAALRAARAAWAAAEEAKAFTGEYAFGLPTGEPTVVGVFGDSIACGLGASRVEHTFGGHVAHRLAAAGRVVCRIAAVSGAKARTLARQQVAGDERFALVSIGSNDTLYGAPMPEVETALGSFLARLSHARRVIVVGPGDVGLVRVLPSLLRPLMRQRSLAYERVIRRAVAGFENARHIGPSDDALRMAPEDFGADGVHPSDAGQLRIAQAVMRHIPPA